MCKIKPTVVFVCVCKVYLVGRIKGGERERKGHLEGKMLSRLKSVADQRAVIEIEILPNFIFNKGKE